MMFNMRLMKVRRGLVWVVTLGLSLVSFASLSDAVRMEITAALEDGFYELAEQQIRSSARDVDGELDLVDQALLAHALWGQGRFEAVLDEISDASDDERLRYWVARTYMNLGDFEAGLARLEGDQSVGVMAVDRLRLKGRLLVELDRLEEAEGVFLRFESMAESDEAMAENAYDLAWVLRKQNRVDEALEQLRKVEAIAGGELIYRVRLLLAELLVESDADEAGAIFESLMKNVEAGRVYRLQAAHFLAEREMERGDLQASIRLLEQTIDWIDTSVGRVERKTELAQLCQKMEQWELALRWIEAAQVEVESRAWALRLQMQKARVFLGQLNFKRAEEVFQSVLDVSEESSQRSWAYYGRGQALLELGRPEEAAYLFEQAFRGNKEVELASRALFKAADAYYQAERFEQARVLYQQFLKSYPAHANEARGMYQLGLTSARIGFREEALFEFERVVELYPVDALAVESMLRIADVWIAEQQWEKALATYSQLERNAVDAEVVKLSRLQRGLLLYALGEYGEAERIFFELTQSDQQSESVLQAIYMRAFSVYMLGNVDESLGLCRRFIVEHPDSIWTPEVLFWLAEQAFNSGDFAEAERQFLRIYMDYQSHALSEKALYQAGRAAMRTRMFTVSIERFSELVRVYPESVLLPQARFSQGDALTELGEHARAILAFEEVLKNFPQHSLAFAAQGRVADCQFALGADQPERYQVAFEGYRALLERVNLDRELRLQSLYKMGRCAQKMDRPDEAFEAYMQVVYSFLSEGLVRSSKNLVWFTRAGFAAAALQADLENPRGAIAVYDRMVEAAVPASKEAQQRADAIRDRLQSVGQELE